MLLLFSLEAQKLRASEIQGLRDEQKASGEKLQRREELGHGRWRISQRGQCHVENTLCKKKKAKRGEIIVFLVDFCFISGYVLIFTASCEAL